MRLEGIWLPIVTPFVNDEVDYASYERLIDLYLAKGITGLIPLGTTGESPVIFEHEYEGIIEKTTEITNGRVPVYVGIGGNHTQKVLKALTMLNNYNVDGILSVCPYYNRPSQEGLYEHFLRISESTDLNIIIYNIPYRTGINLENETLFHLAEQENIVAVKDSCGNIKQSLELLAQKPQNLSVLTGEDILFYTSLVNGGDGGILASAHLHTRVFVDIYHFTRGNDHHAALERWRAIETFIPLLFLEPNPAPIKYCLSQMELITSDETRLPLIGISGELKRRLGENLNLE